MKKFLYIKHPNPDICWHAQKLRGKFTVADSWGNIGIKQQKYEIPQSLLVQKESRVGRLLYVVLGGPIDNGLCSFRSNNFVKIKFTTLIWGRDVASEMIVTKPRQDDYEFMILWRYHVIWPDRPTAGTKNPPTLHCHITWVYKIINSILSSKFWKDSFCILQH